MLIQQSGNRIDLFAHYEELGDFDKDLIFVSEEWKASVAEEKCHRSISMYFLERLDVERDSVVDSAFMRVWLRYEEELEEMYERKGYTTSEYRGYTVSEFLAWLPAEVGRARSVQDALRESNETDRRS